MQRVHTVVKMQVFASIKTTPLTGQEGTAVITWVLLLHRVNACQA